MNSFLNFDFETQGCYWWWWCHDGDEQDFDVHHG